MTNYCWICYRFPIDINHLCDRCDNYYCEDCSYIFGIHYQHEGNRCYSCADQSRLKELTKEERRNNKLKLILNEIKFSSN